MPQTFLANNIFIIITGMVLLTESTACKKQSIPDPVSAVSIADFETRLDSLRKGTNIPGLVAGVIKGGQIIWTKNYGYADMQKNIPVTNSTIFHLASLTKTFASTVIIQLVNENKISLNAPVADYGINLIERDTVRVIHLLTHTSEGVPGSNFKYNGDRYALLSKVIYSATGETFHKLANDRIMQPLGLLNTAPGDMKLAIANGYDTARLMQITAQGYSSNGTQMVDYPTNFSTAAGLISNAGKTLPYGLGWFIQEKEGIKFSWHYGYWTGMSSLIIRVPEEKLSFIIMANSDMLSAPYALGNGDIWVSPYAKEFLKSFVLAGAKL